MFLAGVAVSLDLPADTAGAGPVRQPARCASTACPTGAIVDAYELDATRCISYLTIELDGRYPETSGPGIGDHVFGCDICQDVCPWNLRRSPRSIRRGSRAPDGPRLRRGGAVAALGLRAARLFEGSAMTRTPLSRLRRNLAVVLGNSRRPGAVACSIDPAVARAAPR